MKKQRNPQRSAYEPPENGNFRRSEAFSIDVLLPINFTSSPSPFFCKSDAPPFPSISLSSFSWDDAMDRRKRASSGGLRPLPIVFSIKIWLDLYVTYTPLLSKRRTPQEKCSYLRRRRSNGSKNEGKGDVILIFGLFPVSNDFLSFKSVFWSPIFTYKRSLCFSSRRHRKTSKNTSTIDPETL